jgi:hypothetical protein
LGLVGLYARQSEAMGVPGLISFLVAFAGTVIRRGVAVIPVPPGEKNPGRPGWEALRISEEEVPDHWTNGQNVGILCGEPSGWLTDVDLDSSEAVAAADLFLPPTLASGRESRPHSHRWYRCEEALSRDWKDTSGEKLVELRSTGRQTLVAPSIHPEGDRYLWYRGSGLEAAEIGPLINPWPVPLLYQCTLPRVKRSLL